MLVDAHTHLDHYHGSEIEEVINEISQLPCKTWAVSMSLNSWEKTKKLAAHSPLIMPTFGIHPWEAHHYADRLDELDDSIAESVHIGEIGLDFHWVKDKKKWPLQEIVFDYCLDRAAAQRKVVNLHTKGAEQLVLDKLRHFKVERAIVHWYSGDVATFDQLVAYDCFFTFGVELASNPIIQVCAQRCPPDRLLTETDGPGGLEWLTGERARPSHLQGVVHTLAAVIEWKPEDLMAQIERNYDSLIDG